MNAAVHIQAASRTALGHVRLGEGPRPVLVLHDWLGDHSNYAALMPRLDGNAYTYVFADLRGYGLSAALTGEYSVAEIVSDSLALADSLGWPQFHVVGHSMTEMITQALAAEAPERVLSAIAVCPVSAAGNRLSVEARAFFASTVHDDLALSRLFAFVGGGMDAEWIAGKLRQNRQGTIPACRLRYLDMLVQSNFVDKVQGLATPFLVLVGDKDPGLDADAMRSTFMAWHVNAELQVMADCGHYPMEQWPTQFAALIEAYLGR